MLATNTYLVAEWNLGLMPTIRGYVTQNKTKGYWTLRKSQLKIAFVTTLKLPPYNSYDVSLENLVLNQLIIH